MKNIERLIQEIELKDIYARALFDHYIDSIEDGKISQLQQYVDDVCNSWVRTFIALNNRELSDRQIQIAIFRYLDSLGVRHGHTGKRFSEALYRKLHELVENKNNGMQQ